MITNHNSIAIYTDSLQENNILIRQIFLDLQHNYDVLVFSDDVNTTDLEDMPVFPSFHMKYFNGAVVFLTLEDFLHYKTNIIGHSLLHINGSMKNLDRSIISKDNIYEIR